MVMAVGVGRLGTLEVEIPLTLAHLIYMHLAGYTEVVVAVVGIQQARTTLVMVETGQ